MQWLRMASIVLLWASGCRLAMSADVGNPLVLDHLNRTGWPDALTSQANVDTASRAEVQRSSGFERLDQTALQTVLRWRYAPGKRAGVPTPMWVEAPIDFVLN